MLHFGLLIGFLILMASSSCEKASAATMDCGGGIISDGDTRADVLAKCGPPDARESHDEELIDRIDGDTKRKIFITVEEWTYDFGPSRLTRIVTLTNGRVADIRTGKYGHNKATGPGPRECSEQVVTVGDLKNEVLSKCGEPSLKDGHVEELSERLENGQVRKTFVNVEEWTYDLGPSRFVRILTFRNGRLVDIRTGGYGR